MAARRRFVNHFSRLSCIVCTHEPREEAIGDPSLPLVPVKLGWNVTVPEGIADPAGWRKMHPYTPAEWLGLNRSPYSDAPYLCGFWLPLLTLAAAWFVRLGRRPVSAPRP